MTAVFITGTGTGIGKTLVAAIVSQALQANYWKPVQAGTADGTDTELVASLVDKGIKCFPELYRFSLPASPHIAAREEKCTVDLELITQSYHTIINSKDSSEHLVIEGAGGLLVPLNDHEFVTDLVLKLRAKVILVSRNYLGSINHSLLTAEACRQRGIDVIGWIFNDEYMHYQHEIAAWSGYPVIGSIPNLKTISPEVLAGYALLLKARLLQLLEKETL